MSKTFAAIFASAIAVVSTALPLGTAQSADSVRAGVLSGATHHQASGHVDVVTEGGVTKVILQDDFSLQDAPAPRLAWGKDGYKRGTIFAKLVKFKGAQEYTVPAGTDLSQYNEFWIWCEQADVALAMAKLK